MSTHYERVMEMYREVSDLYGALALMGWDQETYMPPKGAASRGRQLATLSGMAHERITSDEMRAALDSARSESLAADEEVNIREIARSSDRAVKVPVDLVKSIAETSSAAIGVWIKARQEDDFPAFAPWIDKLVTLQRQVAEAVGYEDEPYDALLDEYEPYATTKDTAAVFESIRGPLVDLVQRIASSGVRPRTDFLERNYPIDDQRRMGVTAAERMGFDFEAGRLDISPHPFCTHMGVQDVRLTTRYSETLPMQSFYGVIHEAGHGLYEQGHDPVHEGTPRGASVSLGIHESQSRLWENMVGRSRAFWRFFFPEFAAVFPDQAADVSEEEVYAAVNEVKPSLIRVEADEITYNLHILLRFEIERGLFMNEFRAGDLSAVWNEKMKAFLGIEPPGDRDGVLQDIHWSHGSFGYFPTYTLGNLYAAQFYRAAERDLPGLSDQIARGELLPLRDWLRDHIHRPGMTHRAGDLVRHVTGEPLTADCFLAYIDGKYRSLYRL
ncbi:MAG: carboxypeptidase M32 [Gemmatimonadetes bacterium]|nr:carboxypeptidase M32 [Gemmatimonadota bacterium]